MSNAVAVPWFLSVSLSNSPVKVVPEAAAHDKEPRVSIPVSEKEERVSALTGSTPESGVV